MARRDRDEGSFERVAARVAARERRRGGAGAPDGDLVFATVAPGLVFVGLLVGAILVFANSRNDLVCNGITNIHGGEQRTCTPRTTVDVRVDSAWNDVVAYRYPVDCLPDMEVVRTEWQNKEIIYVDRHRSFRTTLHAGGSVNLTCRAASKGVFDLFVMTLEQYELFSSSKTRECIWSNISTSSSSTVFTANQSGTYYFVFHAQYQSVVVDDHETVETSVYNVSKSTAKDMCTESCTFKRVHSDEVVILEYGGSRSSVSASVFAGKGPFNRSKTAPLVVLSVLAVVFGSITAIMAYILIKSATNGCAHTKSCGAGTSTSDVTPEQRVDDLPRATPGTTPESDFTTPLISGSINENCDDCSAHPTVYDNEPVENI